MAILVSLVAMGLTASMAPVVVSTITATRTADQRTESIDAANAGLDAAMAQLRAASTGSGATLVGNLETLPPCDITGAENAGDETADTNGKTTPRLRYRVKVAYYGQLEDDNDDTSAVPIACPPTQVPTKAVLTVTGSYSATAVLEPGKPDTRTVESTYTFRRSTANTAGGAIRLGSTIPMCMDGADNAVTKAPTLTLAACKTGGASEQRFAYTKDLNIKLMYSESTASPNGLCLQGTTTNNNAVVIFKPCLGRTAVQQWSLDNNSRLRGTTDGVNVNGYCLNAQTSGSPRMIVLGSCSTGSDQSVWRTDPAAGAGGASADTGQLVNFKQFSRCLDVTNHTPTYPYMIVWFCKQAPDGNVSWNQQWTMPPVATSKETAVWGRIRTAGTSNPGYCLRRPDSPGGLVTMVSCSATAPLPAAIPDELKWKMYGETKDDITRYTIVSSRGECLTPTDLTAAKPETHTDGTAVVRTTRCTKAALLKWNAPPSLQTGKTLSGTTEK
ncbi:RICIN domain-containing protein [Actinoplanes sp. NPDC051859]|uniref:RICIN domain-containing protein n=1 Tax=Actinoplanes sp. NPDC051859 TaxID=3363909 RepID=UPI0037B56FB1